MHYFVAYALRSNAVFPASLFSIIAKFLRFLQVIKFVCCYFVVRTNKQQKQDMHTLMAKLKQQQQSSSAVSVFSCTVLIAHFIAANLSCCPMQAIILLFSPASFSPLPLFFHSLLLVSQSLAFPHLPF